MHTQECKATKNQIGTLQGKPDKVSELILETNVFLNKGSDNIYIIVILGLCFLLTDWFSFAESGGFV